MKRIRIYAYNNGSESANFLAEALDCYLLKHEGSTFIPRKDDLIINWGSTNVPTKFLGNIINHPSKVSIASNKIRFFQHLSQFDSKQYIVPWTTDKTVAQGWYNEGKVVVVRHKLTAHSGVGIEIIDQEGKTIPDAPLYTTYIPKKHEYRIHYFGGKVIDIQKKMRNKNVPDDKVNWRVRHLDGGFVYGRNGFTCPDVVVTAALEVGHDLGLDFCALDVVHNEKTNRAYVLEANTAPGIEGTTVSKYVEAIKELTS